MSAGIFVGADITSLYRSEPIVENITKYDEYTGKPYQKPITKDYLNTFNNINKVNFEKNANSLGLYLFYVESKYLLGQYLEDDLSNEDLHQETLENLTENVNLVKSKIKTLNISLPVNIFFYLDIQCWW